MLARISRRFSVKLSLPSYKTKNIDENILPKEAETNSEELKDCLTDMMKIRRIEIVADNLYKSGKIRGFLHLSDGQEALAKGLSLALTNEDPLITFYRDHGHAYMRGVSAHEIFGELLGKSTGNAKGKGGSMHFYNEETGFYGGYGIVGENIPIGAGLAFALKYKHKNNVAAITFGDGACNQGQLYEAANMCSLWKLPALFLIENNCYGMGTSVVRASANTQLYTRGDNADIPGIRVDGQDVFAVKELIKFSKDYALEKGPLWIELRTYRYHGHSMSDPDISYREKEEIQEIRKNQDPIEKIKTIVLENEVMTQEEITNLEKSIRKEINEVAKKAEEDPWPQETDIFSDVYDPGTQFVFRNVEHKNNFIANR